MVWKSLNFKQIQLDNMTSFWRPTCIQFLKFKDEQWNLKFQLNGFESEISLILYQATFEDCSIEAQIKNQWTPPFSHQTFNYIFITFFRSHFITFNAVQWSMDHRNFNQVNKLRTNYISTYGTYKPCTLILFKIIFERSGHCDSRGRKILGQSYFHREKNKENNVVK